MKTKNPYKIIQNKSVSDIYIYGDIGESNWFSESVSAKDFVKELATVKTDSINLHINSYGGSVTDGIAIYNALVEHPASIHVTVDGVAASIASVIAMAGDRISMAEGSLLMIHAPWSVTAGDATELREEADLLDKVTKSLADIYVRNTSLNEEEVMSLLTDGKDHWFNVEEAIDLGIIDEIEEENQIINLVEKDLSVKHPSFLNIFKSETKEEILPKMNEEDIKVEFRENEKVRRNSIKSQYSKFIKEDSKVQEILDSCLEDFDCSLEEANSRLLDYLSDKSKPTPTQTQVNIIEDQKDKFIKGATASIEARCGLSKDDSHNDYRGYTLSEIARASLAVNNVPTNGLGKLQLVASAFTHTSSDFTNILMDVANKSMLKGYDEAEETFQLWTATGSLSDFKTSHRVSLNSFPNLDLVPEGGEYQFGSLDDHSESLSLATYGKMFSITRQAIINDDLNAFSVIPQRMGRAAKRTIGDMVYNVLTSNPTMSDGNNLFDATNHKNNITASTSLTSANIDAVRVAMAKQKDSAGHVLNIGLTNVLVPLALQGAALTVRDSTTMVTDLPMSKANANNTPNYVRGTFDVIADARLDESSATNWYGLASASQFDVIEVLYLDGQQTPYMEQQQGWDVDGTVYKIRIDAGVKALDWRTLVKVGP